MMHDEDILIFSRNLILVKKKSMPHPFVGLSQRPGFFSPDIMFIKY